MSNSTIRLDQLAPRHKRLLGLCFIGLALATAWLVHAHPDRLRAPAWLAWLACGALGLAGAAVLLHGVLSPRIHAGVMAVLLAMLTAVPGWIAWGPGERSCVASARMVAGESRCRLVFGAGALVLAVMAGVATRQAIRADLRKAP